MEREGRERRSATRRVVSGPQTDEVRDEKGMTDDEIELQGLADTRNLFARALRPGRPGRRRGGLEGEYEDV